MYHARAAAAAFMAVAWSSAAFANKDLGDVAGGIKTQLANVGDMIGAIAFLIGIILVILSLMKFKAHSENDPQAKMSTAVVMLLVGASMIALPTLAGVGITSIFGDSTTNTNLSTTGQLQSIKTN